MIEIKNLKKSFHDTTPLKNVNATINDGDVISIIGPSGTGKSTLLRCINLLEKPSSGTVIVDGTDITAAGTDIKKARQKMGMVFQSFNLFGHLTVIENLMLAPIDLLGKSRQEAYYSGIKLLKRVGLVDKALSYPDELSGGQQQRVAIARTLAMDPDIIMLDEPTSALDPTMVSEVQAVIRDLAQSKKTMLIVTHEMNFAKTISNRIFYMDQGEIYEEGTPDEIFGNPKRELTRQFIKGLRVFNTVIDRRDHDFIAFNAELDRFLFTNNIIPKYRYLVRLVIEEIVQQILLPEFNEPYIKISLEYSEQEQKYLLDIYYRGDRFDINDTDNALSLSVIKSTVQSMKYSFNPDNKEANSVEIML